MTPEEFASVLSGSFFIEFLPSDPENGRTGREPDYAPWTVVVSTYQDEEAMRRGKTLPEDEWFRYAGYELEETLDWVASDLGLALTPKEAEK